MRTLMSVGQPQSQAITAGKLAELLHGELRGNPETLIDNIEPLETAGPSDVTFLDPKAKRTRTELQQKAESANAGCILIREYDQRIQSNQIIVPNPMAAVIQLAHHMQGNSKPSGKIHPQASI